MQQQLQTNLIGRTVLVPVTLEQMTAEERGKPGGYTDETWPTREAEVTTVYLEGGEVWAVVAQEGETLRTLRLRSLRPVRR